MQIENLQTKDTAMDRIQQLKDALNRLTQGVVISETNERIRTIQEYQLQRLKEDIGVLLVCASPNRTISSLWDLVEPHLPEEIRRDEAQFKKYQNLFSQPLVGQPSKVLAKTEFSKEASPMFEILQRLRKNLSPDQHQMLPRVVGRLI